MCYTVDTLAPYQATVARSVLDSVLHGRGLRLTVQIARDAGAEDISAQVEFLLLALHGRVGGRLLKLVPASGDGGLERVTALLAAAPLPGPWSHRGNAVRAGKAELLALPADRAAEAAGPLHLIEVVDAQRVDSSALEALMREHPEATVVCYGTPWTGASAFERLAGQNEEMERTDGLRCHFRVPWDVAAAEQPGYSARVTAAQAHLGADHPEFVTAYELRAAQPETPLLPHGGDVACHGQGRRRCPVPGARYVASVVVTSAAGHPTDDADGAVVTLAELAGSPAPRPGAVARPGHALRVVEHRWLAAPLGSSGCALRAGPAALERGLAKLLVTWHASAVAVSAGGRLADGFPGRFADLGALAWAEDSSEAVTRRAFSLFAAARTGGLAAYAPDGSPERSAFGHALRTAVIQLLPGGLARLHSPDGGDAFLSGLALLTDASEAAAHAAVHEPRLEPALAS